MQEQFEATYHAVEERHWWFVGRRALVRQLVRRATASRDARILEIGCSGGPLLQQLRRDGYVHLTGIDISREAIAVCHARGVPDTFVMDAQRLEYPAETFDVITASDVLEHIVDAPGALRDWRRALKPGGTLLLFVPAFMFLWSEHDVANLHHHRYRAAELRRALIDAGFAVERSSYWNFLLFAPTAAVRMLKNLLAKPGAAAGQGDLKATSSPLNTIFAWLLAIENRILLSGLNAPFGISAWAIARKP
jgi:SAM-dependent methyltransferase